MNDAELIIERLLSYYNVFNTVELAIKMNSKAQNISKWKTRNSVTGIKKKCRELGIYDEIFKDSNEEKITNNQNNPAHQLFDILYQSHLDNNTLSALEESLKQQIILEKISPIFRDMYSEKNFFKYLMEGHYSNKTANLLLLNRILLTYKEDEIELKNAKDTLLKLVDEYNNMEEFKIIIVGRKAQDIKDTLIDFINNKIDDLAAYTILTNIPNIIEAIKENLSKFNQLIFLKEKNNI